MFCTVCGIYKYQDMFYELVLLSNWPQNSNHLMKHRKMTFKMLTENVTEILS